MDFVFLSNKLYPENFNQTIFRNNIWRTKLFGLIHEICEIGDYFPVRLIQQPVYIKKNFFFSTLKILTSLLKHQKSDVVKIKDLSVMYHSHTKRKDSVEGILNRILFAAEPEFPKILVLRLLQNPSDVNIECDRKSSGIMILKIF